MKSGVRREQGSVSVEPHAGRRWRLAWYGVTVFASSACLLVSEMAAGRLLAPYLGVPLYIWTSIIGVVLAGLSLGNWLGGRWADRGAQQWAAGATMLLAGLASLAVLWLLTLVAPQLQQRELDLLTSSFLYAAGLFFVPAALLGVITPLLATLALRLDVRVGHVVGRMHALSALGSITGTFLTGHYLVQYLGTHRVILGAAAVLVVLGLAYLGRRGLWAALAAVLGAAALVTAAYVRQGLTSPCESEGSYYCICVEETDSGEVRTPVLDHLAHGTNHRTEPGLLISPYLQGMDGWWSNDSGLTPRCAISLPAAGPTPSLG